MTNQTATRVTACPISTSRIPHVKKVSHHPRQHGVRGIHTPSLTQTLSVNWDLTSDMRDLVLKIVTITSPMWDPNTLERRYMGMLGGVSQESDKVI